jgi:hypothetical protein
MGIQETKIPQHWNYFLALEDDVLRLSRYLEPTQHNFDSYSLELARILFSASSEVDVVFKRLCQKLNSQSKAASIGKYKQEILAGYPQLVSTTIEIPRFGLTLTPWERWGIDEKPLWWTAYNKVKHHRHTHFTEASLKHTLNAVAGLFIVLLFYYHAEGQIERLQPISSLFHTGSPFRIDRPMWGGISCFYSYEQQP